MAGVLIYCTQTCFTLSLGAGWINGDSIRRQIVNEAGDEEVVETTLIPTESGRAIIGGEEVTELMRAAAALLGQSNPGQSARIVESLQTRVRAWIVATMIAALAAVSGWWMYSTDNTRFNLLLDNARDRQTESVREMALMQSRLESRERESATLLGQLDLLKENQITSQGEINQLYFFRRDQERKMLQLEDNLKAALSRRDSAQSRLAQSLVEAAKLNERLALAKKENEQFKLQIGNTESALELARQKNEHTLSRLQDTESERVRLEERLEHLPAPDEGGKNTPLTAGNQEPLTYQLGVFYRDSGDYTAAALQFNKTLQLDPGHFGSMMNLAHQYTLGRGVKQSLEEAFRLYKLVADKSDNLLTADALYIVGIYYLRGTGTAPSRTEGRNYLTRAAARGHQKAQVALETLNTDK